MNTIDYSWHPEGYFEPTDPEELMLSRVTGAIRREAVRKMVREGGIDAVPEGFGNEELSDRHRTAWGRIHPMCMGRDTIEWMYGKQFKTGGEWSVRADNGFRWWPTDRAQTVEVVGEADGPSGERGYYISVRTDMFKARSLDGDALKAINMTLMTFASLAGPVYDPRRGTLDLCSWALVYEEISPWMNILLSIAAAMQIHEAQRLGDKFGDFGLENAVSGHPENGIREGWDKISDLLPAFISAQGREPSRWTAPEFQHAADLLGNIPPVLLATAGGPGLSAEFPFGTFPLSAGCRRTNLTPSTATAC